MTEKVSYKVSDGIGKLSLSRPDALNAIDGSMIDDMRRIVADASSDPGVRVLVLAGGNRAFSTGIDLRYLEDILPNNAKYFAFNKLFNSLLLELEEAPLPTIAMIRGFALAGGLELLLACDFAIASTDAVFGDQHANYGLMPGGGSTQRLARRIGMQRAKELFFTGCRLNGTQAQEAGIVLRAVPDGSLEDETQALADQLVVKSKLCTAYTKRAVQRGENLPMRQAIDQESHALFEYFTSSVSPQEGLAAFRERRAPVFPE